MSDLAGLHAIVTAGPTLEPIDPVRFLSNRSSGKQGYAIAEALAARGARVTLVSGPVALAAPAGVARIDVETARDMLAAVQTALPADIFVAVAAVADWRPAEPARQKIKSDKSAGAHLELIANPDILKTVSNLASDRPALVIGFAAETEAVAEHGRAKRIAKGCDWIVANDVSGDAMGGDENAALLITPEGETEWPRAAKAEIAARLAEAIASRAGTRRTKM